MFLFHFNTLFLLRGAVSSLITKPTFVVETNTEQFQEHRRSDKNAEGEKKDISAAIKVCHQILNFTSSIFVKCCLTAQRQNQAGTLWKWKKNNKTNVILKETEDMGSATPVL